MKNNLNLINMRDVPIEPVQWLWYPYIPIGKLTMVSSPMLSCGSVHRPHT